MKNPAKQSVSWHDPILLELRFTDTGAVEKRIGYGRRWAAHQSQTWLMDAAERKEKGPMIMGGKIPATYRESRQSMTQNLTPFLKERFRVIIRAGKNRKPGGRAFENSRPETQ